MAKPNIWKGQSGPVKPGDPDFGKLRQIAQTAEKEKPLSMAKWQALMKQAQAVCGGNGFLTEFLVAYYPGKL